MDEPFSALDAPLAKAQVKIADYSVVNGKEILIEDSIRELNVYDVMGNLGKKIKDMVIY